VLLINIVVAPLMSLKGTSLPLFLVKGVHKPFGKHPIGVGAGQELRMEKAGP